MLTSGLATSGTHRQTFPRRGALWAMRRRTTWGPGCARCCPGTQVATSPPSLKDVIDPIWLKAYLKPLLLPPTGLLLLAVIGLAIRRRFPRVGIALAWTGVLVLLALSMPVVSAILLRSLDSSPPIDIEHASAAQAI